MYFVQFDVVSDFFIDIDEGLVGRCDLDQGLAGLWVLVYVNIVQNQIELGFGYFCDLDNNIFGVLLVSE